MRPRGLPRSPYAPNPYPSPAPPPPPRDRTAEILTISILAAAFLLLGLGGMLWAIETRVAWLGPTPTPTATPAPSLTPTPDFRTTRLVEDFLTQQARQVAVIGPQTPDATPRDTGDTGDSALPPAESDPLPTDAPPAEPPPATDLPSDEPTAPPAQEPGSGELPVTLTPVTSYLPDVSVSAPPPPTPLPSSGESPLPTPPAPEVPTATPEPPTPTATFTPPPVAPPTETPPTETPPPIATDQPFVVERLNAVTREQGARARVGPSALYMPTNALIGGNTQVNLIGRSPSGEWVYLCCQDNQIVWVRQVEARPRDNTLPGNAPGEASPNDVRWLPIQPASPALEPLPALVAPGPGDYPFARVDRAARGRVATLPIPPLSQPWPNVAQAGGAFSSPAAVFGSSVLAGSLDNHLYSFDITNGSQRWRFNVGAPIRVAPMIYAGGIYVADDSRTVRMLEDRGNGAAEIWRRPVALPVITSFNIYSDTLFFGIGEGANHTLIAMHRDSTQILREYPTSGPGLRFPTIGDQLVYVADGYIDALDVVNGELVWSRPDITDIIADPVYSTPGPRALAELYIATATNRIYLLDANTGDEVWNIDTGEAATGLAVNDTTLFVAGNGYVKAISRRDNNILWRAGVGGQVMGGPLVDGARVLVITQAGNAQFLDATNGAPLGSAIISAPAGGAGAVSGPWIYVPGADGRLYALLGVQ